MLKGALVYVFCFLIVLSSYSALAGYESDTYPIEVAILEPVHQMETADAYILFNNQTLIKEIAEFDIQVGTSRQHVIYDGTDLLHLEIRPLGETHQGDKITIILDKFVAKDGSNMPLRYSKFVSYSGLNISAVHPDESIQFKQHSNWLYETEYQSELDQFRKNQPISQGFIHPVDDNYHPNSKQIIDINALVGAYVYEEDIYNGFISRTSGSVWVRMDDYYISNTNEKKSLVFEAEFYKASGKGVLEEEANNAVDDVVEAVKGYAQSIQLSFSDKPALNDKPKITGSGKYYLQDFVSSDTTKHSKRYEEILNGGEPTAKKVKIPGEINYRKFEIKLKSKSDTMWNTGIVSGNTKDSSSMIFVQIDGKAYDKDGELIDDIKYDELFKGVGLIYKIRDNNSQLGFGSDFASELKWPVDDEEMYHDIYSKGPRFYDGPFKPIELVDVYLVDELGSVISNKETYKVEMKDATPEIVLDRQVVQMQDGTDSAFEFKIKDDYHKKLHCKVRFSPDSYFKYHLPIIKISDVTDDKGDFMREFDCAPGERIKIRVIPPSMSNFDVVGALNGLSMWKLQQNTVNNLISDSIGWGVDSLVDARLVQLGKPQGVLKGIYAKGYVKGGSVFRKIEGYEKTIRVLKRGKEVSEVARDVISAKQISNVQTQVDDVKNQASGFSGKGWVERVSDGMVTGINVVQSGVGVVMMAPKYIPVIGNTAVGKKITKLTGKFTLAFNLMTNVWKGNFQYLSKVEKLNRAEEKRMPYPISVQVTTDEGFDETNIQVVSVRYTWLEQ